MELNYFLLNNLKNGGTIIDACVIGKKTKKCLNQENMQWSSGETDIFGHMHREQKYMAIMSI